VKFELVEASPGIFTSVGAEVTGETASVLLTGFRSLDREFEVTVGEAQGEGRRIELLPGVLGVGRAVFKLPVGLRFGSYAVQLRIAGVSSNAVSILLP
jgi:hypothetical protein